jgi:toxin ParE1/3/4
MNIVISPKARSDIASILAWTEANFGPQTLKRYAKLIATAIEQIADNPQCPGSMHRPEIAEHCRTFHLYFTRHSTGHGRGHIRHPRHFLLYRVTESNTVEIGRILHDSMDLNANLPDEYRGSAE